MSDGLTCNAPYLGHGISETQRHTHKKICQALFVTSHSQQKKNSNDMNITVKK